MVSSWSSSFERKCAKRPLFERPTRSASAAIVSPSRPSTDARSAAALKISRWLFSPSERRTRLRGRRPPGTGGDAAGGLGRGLGRGV